MQKIRTNYKSINHLLAFVSSSAKLKILKFTFWWFLHLLSLWSFYFLHGFSEYIVTSIFITAWDVSVWWIKVTGSILTVILACSLLLTSIQTHNLDTENSQYVIWITFMQFLWLISVIWCHLSPYFTLAIK
jgi:hypothetical protein